MFEMKGKSLKRHQIHCICIFQQYFQGYVSDFLPAYITNLFKALREKVHIISIFHIPSGKMMHRYDCNYHSIKYTGNKSEINHSHVRSETIKFIFAMYRALAIFPNYTRIQPHDRLFQTTEPLYKCKCMR